MLADSFNALRTVLAKPAYALPALAVAALASYAIVVFTSIPGQNWESWWFSQPLHNKVFVFLFGIGDICDGN